MWRSKTHPLEKITLLLLLFTAISSKGSYFDGTNQIGIGQVGQDINPPIQSIIPTTDQNTINQDNILPTTDQVVQGVYTNSVPLDIGSEKDINYKYSQLQSSNDVILSDLDQHPEKYQANQDLTDYKNMVYDDIVSKGMYPEQIQAYQGTQNVEVVPTQTDQSITDGTTIQSAGAQSFLSLNMLYPNSDNPKYLLGNNFTRNIKNLPINGQANVTPWSGSYWAMRNGGTSVRYNLNSKNTMGRVNPATGKFIGYYNWYQSVTLYSQPREHRSIYGSSSFPSYVDNVYSAIEKYDFAMGDYYYTGTNYMKRDGARFAKNGDIPGWYGYCDGWAAAAMTFPKPNNAVTITASDGKTSVTFLPSDIQGMATQFMAKANFKTRWIGARCNGNIGSPSCRSLNPGSFVLAITNQIGLRGKSMVCDPLNDDQIWNHPMKAYSLRYYNVITGTFTSDASSGSVSINSVRSCGSAWCRKILATVSPYARFVVGTFIRLTYVIETSPVHTTTSTPDKFKTDNFDSYLELDGSGNIIGGNWKSEYNHPNFCWMPDPNYAILGVSDSAIKNFDGSSAQLRAFTPYAVNASKRGQVLKAFLLYLITKSA